MKPAIRAQLQGYGPDLTPEMMGGTMALFSAMSPPVDGAIVIDRDHRYGPDERNRLDVFRETGLRRTGLHRASLHRAPVLVFVHGGGFLTGDKTRAGSPFYDNVGAAAARAGMVGVTITYRLAPEHTYPSGEEDLALAVGWLRSNVASFGGDPDRIVLMGQSSGAVHVAGYVAHSQHHVAAHGGIAGAVMISGKYDTTTCAENAGHFAYYGAERQGWPPASCGAGLLASTVPLLFSVSEFDPADFKMQAAQLVGEWGAAGRYPEMHYLAGHNHLSPALSIGSDAREVERMVTGFVRRVTG